jgi:hypothetical protein
LQLRSNRGEVKRPLAYYQILRLLAFMRVVFVRLVLMHGVLDVAMAHTVR